MKCPNVHVVRLYIISLRLSLDIEGNALDVATLLMSHSSCTASSSFLA